MQLISTFLSSGYMYVWKVCKVRYVCNLPLEITFPSAHHSPNTVNKNAKEFVMGTVKLNSVFKFPESNQSVVKILVQQRDFLIFVVNPNLTAAAAAAERKKEQQQQRNQTKEKRER